MIVLVALAGHDERLAVRKKSNVVGDVDVGVGLLGKDLSGDQLFHPAGAVSHLDVQDALVAVHGEHEQLFARNAPFHTGDVFRFRVHHRACFFAFQIKYLDLDLGIFLAGLWVF